MQLKTIKRKKYSKIRDKYLKPVKLRINNELLNDCGMYRIKLKKSKILLFVKKKLKHTNFCQMCNESGM